MTLGRKNWLVCWGSLLVAGFFVAPPARAEPVAALPSVHTVFVLDSYVGLGDVADTVSGSGARIVSFRHGGATSGGFEVGSLTLAEAVSRYSNWHLETVGARSVPEIFAFRVEGSVPTDALGALSNSVAGRVEVAPEDALVVFPASSSGGPEIVLLEQADADTSLMQTTSSETSTASGKAFSWMPDEGELQAFEGSSGQRILRNTLAWKSQQDIASFGETTAYEHNLALFNHSITDPGLRPDCPNDDFWAQRTDELYWSTTYPADAGNYFDTDLGDPCFKSDLTIGVYRPQFLQANTEYITYVTAEGGPTAQHSPFELGSQRAPRNCDVPLIHVGINDPICVGELENETSAYQPLIEESPTCFVPATYSWKAAGAPSTNGCYSDRLSGDGLMGYWRLNETSGATAGDASGSQRNGTYQNGVTLGVRGATYTDGDKAARFDGVDDNVYIANTPVPATGSLELWGRTTRPGVAQYFATWGADWQVALKVNGANRAEGSLKISGTNYQLSSSKVIGDGAWHHLVLTYDGGVGRLYVDGSEVKTVLQAGILSPGSIADELMLGDAHRCGGCELDGDVDEVTIYNRALTPTEVSDHFNAAGARSVRCNGGSTYSDVVCSHNPVGYWRLGDQGGTVAADQTSLENDGAYQSGAASGYLGALPNEPDTSARFDGVDDKVHIPAEPYGHYANPVGSVEAWARTTRTGRSQHIATHGADWQMTVRFGSNDKAEAFLKVHGILKSFGGKTYVAEGKWHHFVLTYDGSHGRLYVDGKLDGELSAPGQLDILSGTGFHLGVAPSCGGCEMQGDVDEVAIYDRALTAAEVAAHFDAAGSTSVSCLGGIVFWDRICNSKPIGYWKLDEASGPTAEDSTSVESDGLYENGATPGAAGVSGTAVRVDGVDDRVRIPYDPYGRYATDYGSVEGWVKTTRSGRSQHVITRGADWQMTLRVGSADKAEAFVKVNGVLTQLTGSTQIADGGWHHVALTYNGNFARLYVNGAEEAQRELPGKLDWVVGSGFYLGLAPSCGGCELQGDIDEVAVFDRALTVNEVSSHATR